MLALKSYSAGVVLGFGHGVEEKSYDGTDSPVLLVTAGNAALHRYENITTRFFSNLIVVALE